MWTLENIHVNSIHQLNGSLAAQNAVPGPVAWESPGSLLNIQNFKFTPDLLNQNLQKHCSLLEVKKKKKTVTHYTTKSTCDYWISVTEPGNFSFHGIYDILNTFCTIIAMYYNNNYLAKQKH